MAVAEIRGRQMYASVPLIKESCFISLKMEQTLGKCIRFGRRISEMCVWWVVSEGQQMPCPEENRNGKEGIGVKIGERGMQGSGWRSGQGDQEEGTDISPLPVTSSGTWWSLLFLPFSCTELWRVPHPAFLVVHSASQGLGPFRVCEGPFPLLPSLSGNQRASFIPSGRSELLDPLGPCHCETFCSLLCVSLALPARSELLVGPWRDLDSTPDLNIWKMGRHKLCLCTEGNLAELPVMRPAAREAGWMAPERGWGACAKVRWAERSHHKRGMGLKPSLLWGAAAKPKMFTALLWATPCGDCVQLQPGKPVLDPIRYNVCFSLITCMRLWRGTCDCPLPLPPAFPAFCHGLASDALDNNLSHGPCTWATHNKCQRKGCKRWWCAPDEIRH